MKLWLLQANSDPAWNKVFGGNLGFVIRAASEEDARQMASLVEDDESRIIINPWKDPSYSDCIELTADGDADIIMTDYCE